MMRKSRSVLRFNAAVGLSLVAIAATGAGAGTAWAQESGQGQSTIDILNADIIVTATKKKDVENVQSVPVAINSMELELPPPRWKAPGRSPCRWSR